MSTNLGAIQWREKIIYSWWLFCAALVFCFLLMLSNHTVFVYPLLLTYITTFIGLSKLPQWAFLKTGDYSYGIYLYGHPITQALIAAIPAMRGNLFLLFPTTVLCTCVFAFLSWHLVENRVLFLKRYLSPGSAKVNETLYSTSTATLESRNVRSTVRVN